MKAYKLNKTADHKEHFSIRKLTIGAASVLLSTSLYFSVSTLTSNNVLAATDDSTHTQLVQKQQGDQNTTGVAKSEEKANQEESAPSKNSDEKIVSEQGNKTQENQTQDPQEATHVSREYKIIEKKPRPTNDPNKYGEDKVLLDWKVDFNREAKKDPTTGKTIYGNWQVTNGNGRTYYLSDANSTDRSWNTADNSNTTQYIMSKMVSLDKIPGYEIKSTAFPSNNPDKLSIVFGNTAVIGIDATLDKLKNNSVLPSQTFYVNYSPEVGFINYQFVDEMSDNAFVGHQKEISAHIDENIEDLGLQVPEHYVLAKDQVLPNGKIFTTKDSSDSLVYIRLDHKNDPANIDNLYGHDKDEYEKTIKRTILAITPHDGIKDLSQTLTFQRTGKFDEVFQKVFFNKWQSNKDTFATVLAPEVDGYTPSQSKVDEFKPDDGAISEWEKVNHKYIITYKANEQNINIIYKTGDKVVKEDSLKGHTDETVNVKVNIPNGYLEVKGQNIPDKYTFKASNNQNIIIYLIQPESVPVPDPQPTAPTTPVEPDQPTEVQPTAPDNVQPLPEVPTDDNDTVKPLPQTVNNKEEKKSKKTTDKAKASTVSPKASKKHEALVQKKVQPSVLKASQVKASTPKEMSAKSELPQTGESQNKLGLIGLAFASIAGLFGLAADRKRKN